MKIFVGLGNPTNEYAKTKHNVGFMLVDALADKLGIDNWQDKFDAKVAQGFLGTEKILLVKPLTYMNESGRAIGPLMSFYKLEPEDLIVVHDDMDIPAGTVRIRKKGSAPPNTIGSKAQIINSIFYSYFVSFRKKVFRVKSTGWLINRSKHVPCHVCTVFICTLYKNAAASVSRYETKFPEKMPRPTISRE